MNSALSTMQDIHGEHKIVEKMSKITLYFGSVAWFAVGDTAHTACLLLGLQTGETVRFAWFAEWGNHADCSVSSSWPSG